MAFHGSPADAITSRNHLTLSVSFEMPWPTFKLTLPNEFTQSPPCPKKESLRLPLKLFSWPFIWESHEKSFIKGIGYNRELRKLFHNPESGEVENVSSRGDGWLVSCDTRVPVLVFMILKIEFSPEELNTERTSVH